MCSISSNKIQNFSSTRVEMSHLLLCTILFRAFSFLTRHRTKLFSVVLFVGAAEESPGE